MHVVCELLSLETVVEAQSGEQKILICRYGTFLSVRAKKKYRKKGWELKQKTERYRE
jgi:hypothetical protein